ncbi:MAG TPA: DNA polymerase Y family protein [Vicinamibacterales bacterium]|nr:DNA polymerase Y family protein [Vicinamibacterales bacterium]
MFGALYAAEGTDHCVLETVAREFSPRIEVCSPREITLDLSGLERLFGEARAIAHELRRTAADRGVQVRVAIAGTRTAARLFVHHRAGITVIDRGSEAEMLASLPLGLLDAFGGFAPMARARRGTRPTTPNFQPPTSQPESTPTETLRRWGLRTLGEFAALPSDDVAARLGVAGVEWQRVARGEDQHPLVPALPDERFEQTLELEWPIEGLEPLSFVLGRLMEPLSVHLERRDRGAAVLHIRLYLITRTVHERSLQLPAPMRDARALRTLALLDLESHPPDAAIDRVTVAVEPTPGRVVQFSLLTRPLPSPEQLSTLNARLAALMGEGRCGSPEPVDSWRPGAFAMKPFNPGSGIGDQGSGTDRIPNPGSRIPTTALRRFRTPISARVRVEDGRPVRVEQLGLGGRVEVAAGPWRTSGAWWVADEWNRDEWDVALGDGVTYRVFHERLRTHASEGEAGRVSPRPRSGEGGWFIEGIVD